MKSPRYFAYLLRIWQAGCPDQPEWRASIEEPHTHLVTGFDSLAALCQHLRSLSEESEPEEPRQTNHPSKETP